MMHCKRFALALAGLLLALAAPFAAAQSTFKATTARWT